jgi:hypothetical protein
MFKVAKALPGYKALQAELLQAGVMCIDKLCFEKKDGLYPTSSNYQW